MTRLPVVILTVALASTPLAGCGGGSSTTAVQTTTTGQQLVDLKRALDEGVITQREYESKRRDILRND